MITVSLVTEKMEWPGGQWEDKTLYAVTPLTTGGQRIVGDNLGY